MAEIKQILVPDIGNFKDVKVIEVMVKAGDTISVEDNLITLETDKAAMDVPSPYAGVIKEMKVKAGDTVSQGSVILLLESSDEVQVKGSGEKGRVTKDDVQNFVKAAIAQPRGAAGSGLQVLAMPIVDFAQFGPIETKPLSRIQKLSGANLHRNWVSVPHVTQFDEADIGEMEAFRKQLNEEYAKQNIKITPLAFLLKAVEAALRQHPDFNASLDASGENLVLKKYFHIGVAVDTPDGLMVPVLRDVDKKGIVQLAKELGEISAKARDKKLSAAEMQGGCFTISSLGGIGGTAFTPIINAPEVAILGVSRASMKPIYMGGEFVPRLMLPLSLSYDHRVIDGASAVRFTVFLTQVLADIRRLVL